MKNVLQVFLKDHTSTRFEVLVEKTKDTFLKVHELQQGTLPLFLEIEHQQLNTLLELTKVFPYVLLYFDAENGNELFKGAAFNLNNLDKPFSISTQYKKILLLQYPISFNLEEVSHLLLLS